jgi:hypothetical protein
MMHVTESTLICAVIVHHRVRGDHPLACGGSAGLWAARWDDVTCPDCREARATESELVRASARAAVLPRQRRITRQGPVSPFAAPRGRRRAKPGTAP